MNVTCNVIGDLLPLYMEKMVSEDTVLLVQEHLASCESCRAKAKAMMPQEEQKKHEIRNLPKLEKSINKRRKTAVLFAFLLTATLLLSAWGYLMGPVYLPAEEADVRWYYGDQVSYIYSYENGVLTLPSDKQDGVLLENAVLMLYMSPLVNRVSESRTVDPDTGKEIVTITASCRRIDKLCPKDPFGDYVHTLEVDFNTLYYAALDGSEDMFLWGEEPSGGVQTLPRLVLGYYVVIAVVIAVILLACAAAFRKKRESKLMFSFGCFFAGFVPSAILVSGGHWPVVDTADVPWMFGLAVVLAYFMAATVHYGCKVWKQHKEEL